MCNLSYQLADLNNWPTKACEVCVRTMDAIRQFRSKILSTQYQLASMVPHVKYELGTGTQPTAMLQRIPWNGAEAIVTAALPVIPKIEPVPHETPPQVYHHHHLPPKKGHGSHSGSGTLPPPNIPHSNGTGSVVAAELQPAKAYDNRKDRDLLEAELRKLNLLACHVCQQETDSYLDLMRHIRETHHRVGYVFCCNRIFVRNFSLEHMRYHLDRDAYKCPGCWKRCMSQDQLRKHKNECKMLMGRDCDVVKRTVSSRARQEKRAVLETEMRRLNLLVCHMCQLETQSYADLMRHIRETHHRVGYIFCCNRSFARNYALEHMRYHLDRDTYKCTACWKCFMSQDQLRKHRATCRVTANGSGNSSRTESGTVVGAVPEREQGNNKVVALEEEVRRSDLWKAYLRGEATTAVQPEIHGAPTSSSGYKAFLANARPPGGSGESSHHQQTAMAFGGEALVSVMREILSTEI